MAGFELLPGPMLRSRLTREHARHIKPNEPFGRFARAGIAPVLGWEFYLPAVARGLADKKWKRSFCELHEGVTVGFGCEQDFARDFGSVAFHPPYGLSFSN